MQGKRTCGIPFQQNHPCSNQCEFCFSPDTTISIFSVRYTKHWLVKARRVTLHPAFPACRNHANPSLIRHNRRTLILTNTTSSLFRIWRILRRKPYDRDLGDTYNFLQRIIIYINGTGSSDSSLCGNCVEQDDIGHVFHRVHPCFLISVIPTIFHVHFLIVPPTMYNLSSWECRQMKRLSCRIQAISRYLQYCVPSSDFAMLQSGVRETFEEKDLPLSFILFSIKLEICNKRKLRDLYVWNKFLHCHILQYSPINIQNLLLRRWMFWVLDLKNVH
jgi:hypothetical protein